MPKTERISYAKGVSDGLGFAYFEARAWLSDAELSSKPELEKIAVVRKKTALMFEIDALVPVMNDIYHDPANAFISTLDVLFLARDKLLGMDIEKSLVEARRQAASVGQATQANETK